MKAVGGWKLRHRLGEYLRVIKQGETALISDRGQVIAELRPPSPYPNQVGSVPALASLIREREVEVGLPNDAAAYPVQPRRAPDGTGALTFRLHRHQVVGLKSPPAASVLGALLLAAGCGAATEPVDPVAPAFGPAVALPAPVNSPGWEDSGMVTPDGTTLYFTYLRIDPVTFIQTGRRVVTGPLRPGWPTTPPFDTLGAEIYRSRLVAGQWTEPENLGAPINLPQGVEGDQWVSEDGNRILFSDGNASLPDRPQHGLYYAERNNGIWQKPVVASSVGFPFVEFDENPHLTRDEQTLYFESSRPGGLGLQDIWMSRKVNGLWTPAENLGAAVNTPGIDGSPFSLDGRELYWDDKGGGRGISWAARRADGTWTGRTIVLPGPFGDPSLTTTGGLYVIGGKPGPDGGFDADVYLARRR